jgi:hypothetical protein
MLSSNLFPRLGLDLGKEYFEIRQIYYLIPKEFVMKKTQCFFDVFIIFCYDMLYLKNSPKNLIPGYLNPGRLF